MNFKHIVNIKMIRGVRAVTNLKGGRLSTCLADINRQAQERFERFIEGMKQIQSITEQLKDDKPLEWMQRMNNIRNAVEEVINTELIYT